MTRRTIPSNELDDALIVMLLAEPHTADDLARRTGYSATAIREHLMALRILGRTCREISHRPGGAGKQYIWRIGDLDGYVPPPPKSPDRLARRIDEPSQVTVRQYPASHARDPLVSALFGTSQGDAA